MWVPVLLSAALLLFILQSNRAGEVRLGRYFTLDEFTRTDTGLPNIPSAQEVANLQYLVASVLDPLREQIGPVIITSGFRSPEVNAAIPGGGAINSQHMDGEAADIKSPTLGTDEIIAALRQLPVDQVIKYYNSGHVHVSATPQGRGEFLYKGPSGFEVI